MFAFDHAYFYDANRKRDDVISKRMSYAEKVRTGNVVRGQNNNWDVIST